MKKYSLLALICVIITLICASISCSKQEKVWLVSIGQPKNEVEKILKEKGYKITDKDSVIDIQADVKYLDIDWEEVSIDFDRNKMTKLITFSKYKGIQLTKDQKKNVVSHFDDIYGEHECDKSQKKDLGTVIWSWKKDGTGVIFCSFLDGQVAILNVGKVKDKKQN